MADKRPAFQFYPADFITDPNVAAMDCAARGVYITLLCYCWLQGGVLSRDEKILARLSNTYPAQWKRVRESVLKCFTPDGENNYRHKRLDLERQKQDAWRDKCAEGGRKSGEVRVKGSSTTLELTPQLNTNSSSSSSSSVRTTKRGEREGEREGCALPVADATAPVPADLALVPLDEVRINPKVTVFDLMALWNDLAQPPLAQCQQMSKARTAHAKTRLTEHPDLAWWRSVIHRVNDSDFCKGQNDRTWLASFDWLIANDTNALKVLEGKYDNRVASYGDHVRTRTSGNQDAARQAMALMGITGGLTRDR